MARIIDKDLGYRELIDRVYTLGKPKIAVGIFEADGQQEADDGVTLIEVATINEFGGGHVPSRSFIRAWVDKNQERCREALMSLCVGVLKGEYTAKVAAERFGAWLQGEIQKRIAQGIPPANAPKTIEKKGSSKPLINHRQLRSSVTYAIDWGSGTLRVHKSEATKKRENDAKVAARAARRAAKRKATLRIRARRKAVGGLKKAVKLQARKTLRSVRKGLRQGAKKNSSKLIRTARRTSTKFLRKTKKILRGKKRGSS